MLRVLMTGVLLFGVGVAVADELPKLYMVLGVTIIGKSKMVKVWLQGESRSAHLICSGLVGARVVVEPIRLNGIETYQAWCPADYKK